MTQGPDYGQFRTGQVLQPVSTTGPNSSLQDADPAIFYLLEFLTYVIRTYPGPRIIQEAIAAGVLSSGSPVMDAIANAYPYDPAPEYLENQLSFPALYVFRTAGQTEQWTLGHGHDLCGITVMYVLPPCDSAQSERMFPLLKAVYDAVRKKVDDSWDPGYTPTGGSLGQQWNSPGNANVEEIGFGTPSDKRVAGVPTGFAYGRLPGTGDVWFPALIMRGYIVERDEYGPPTVNGPSKFEGADITANYKDNDGTVLLATSTTVAQTSTQLPPFITSLDVATGPIAGGTTVTLTGLRFLSGPPQVYFGTAVEPQYAASVAFNSSTSLTITTPQVADAGLYDLTVVNRDGQRAVLKGAFTFT